MKFFAWRSNGGVEVCAQEPKARQEQASDDDFSSPAMFGYYFDGKSLGNPSFTVCEGQFKVIFGGVPRKKELWVVTFDGVEVWEWDRDAPPNV